MMVPSTPWTWYLPGTDAGAGLPTWLRGTLGDWSLSFFFGRSRSLNNNQLACRYCSLAFLRTQTPLGNHMHPCWECIVLLSWIRPWLEDRFASPLKSAERSALLCLIFEDLLPAICAASLLDTHDERCLSSVLGRSRSLRNIQLVLRHYGLAFVTVQTIIVCQMRLYRVCIVLLFFLTPVVWERYFYHVKSAKQSALRCSIAKDRVLLLSEAKLLMSRRCRQNLWQTVEYIAQTKEWS